VTAKSRKQFPAEWVLLAEPKKNSFHTNEFAGRIKKKRFPTRIGFVGEIKKKNGFHSDGF